MRLPFLILIAILTLFGTARAAEDLSSLTPFGKELVTLANWGTSDEVLVARIAAMPEEVRLTARDVAYLAHVGVSDRVIAEAWRHADEVPPPAPPTQAATTAAPTSSSAQTYESDMTVEESPYVDYGFFPFELRRAFERERHRQDHAAPLVPGQVSTQQEQLERRRHEAAAAAREAGKDPASATAPNPPARVVTQQEQIEHRLHEAARAHNDPPPSKPNPAPKPGAKNQ